MSLRRIATAGLIAALLSACTTSTSAPVSRSDDRPATLTESDMLRSVMVSL